MLWELSLWAEQGPVGHGDGGGGYHTRPHVREEVVGGGQGDHSLGVSPHLPGLDTGVETELGQDVVKVVEASHRAEVPLELVEDEQLPLADGLEADAEVCVHDELLAGDGGGLFELWAEKKTDGAEQLELGLLDAALGEEAVHQVHGEAEYLGRAAELLTDLQHPVGDNLPHVRLHFHLDCFEVVWVFWQVSTLCSDQVGKHSGVGHKAGVHLGLDLK